MSIRVKLIVVFLLLTLLPLAMIGYVAYDNGSTTLQQNAYNHLLSTAVYKEAELMRWVNGNVDFLEALAQRPLLRQYAAALGVAADGSPDHQTFYAHLMDDHLLPNRDISGFDGLSVIRAADGKILIATDPHLEGKFRESEPYFVEGKKATYVDSVRYILVEGAAAMHIASPIRDDNGEVAAVLVGHVNLQDLSAIMLMHNGLAETEETYLVNEFNFFVTDPRLLPGSALTRAVYSEGVENCLDQQTGYAQYYDYRNTLVLGAYRWNPTLRLCIVTEIDRDEAFASIVVLRNAIVGIGAGLAAGVVVLGMLYARSITEPLGQLVDGVHEIEAGNLQHHIEVRSRDEMSQLAAAFNRMSASLQRSLGETAHSQRMLLALSQAAQAVQQVSTAAAIYTTVGDELATLGARVVIFDLCEDRRSLEIAHTTFDSGSLRKAEKITGVSLQNTTIEIVPEAPYDRLLKTGIPIYQDVNSAATLAANGDSAYARVHRVFSVLGVKHALYAPLLSQGQPSGIIMVAGTDISESDSTAVTVFANQIAIALDNARLYDEIRSQNAGLEQRVAERTRQLDLARIAALNMMQDAEQARRTTDALNQNLELEVAERTRAEQLLAARAVELERSNTELEQFAYVASHDLQEPLRAISGYLQFLQRRYRDKLDERAEMYINRSVAATERMKVMINDLLTFSRVNTRGKDFTAVDLGAIVERARDNLQAAILDTDARITHDPLPAVLGDASQLLQVFQNLLGNALKFHSERPVEIHIGAVRDTEAGMWRLSVRDNGIGIDAQYADRIFIIFQRLHTRDEYPGTGIGLAIVKKIIERHGGRIWVESTPGAGSTFYFTLPESAGD